MIIFHHIVIFAMASAIILHIKTLPVNVFLHPLLGAGRIMNTSRCMYCGNSHKAHENHSPYYTPPKHVHVQLHVFSGMSSLMPISEMFSLVVLYGVPSLKRPSGIPYLVAFSEIW